MEAAADGATGSIADGSYSEPLRGAGLYLVAGEERAGQYDITVNKVGYKEWRRTNVSVLRSGCHVETAELLTLLQPEG
jgi:hypothetical protein